MSSTTGTSAPPEPSALAPDTPSPGNSSYYPPMPMIFCAGAAVRMNILIVEDSRLLRISNERALARARYQVITAADGEEGLRLARENKPDLVILDLMLPKLPGREVLRELRSRPETASIPVMIVSSLPQSNDKKLMEEGATSYFEKAGLMLDKGADTFVQTVTRMLSQSKAAGA